jgi:hypothetical protein
MTKLNDNLKIGRIMATKKTTELDLVNGGDLVSKLSDIQVRLEAPKSQYNSFGKYHYRKCEDILSALKPLLEEHKCVVKLSDEIVEVGGRVYVKATATITDGISSETAVGYAREAVDKKGMDDAQITGTSSSYARKYALNGLFAIDDEQDSDSDHHQVQTDNVSARQQTQTQTKPSPTSMTSPTGQNASRGAATTAQTPEFLTDAQHDWLRKQTNLTGESYDTWLIGRMREIKPDDTYDIKKIPYVFAKQLADKARALASQEVA